MLSPRRSDDSTKNRNEQESDTDSTRATLGASSDAGDNNNSTHTPETSPDDDAALAPSSISYPLISTTSFQPIPPHLHNNTLPPFQPREHFRRPTLRSIRPLIAEADAINAAARAREAPLLLARPHRPPGYYQHQHQHQYQQHYPGERPAAVFNNAPAPAPSPSTTSMQQPLPPSPIPFRHRDGEARYGSTTAPQQQHHPAMNWVQDADVSLLHSQARFYDREFARLDGGPLLLRVGDGIQGAWRGLVRGRVDGDAVVGPPGAGPAAPLYPPPAAAAPLQVIDGGRGRGAAGDAVDDGRMADADADADVSELEI